MKRLLKSTIQMKKTNHFLLLIAFTFLLNSCEENPQEFDTISYTPCSEENATVDPNILNDFECQENFILEDVEVVRNPSEIGTNKSRFVGKYVDGKDAWAAYILDFGKPIPNISTHAVFNIKVKTSISGLMKVKLEGGSTATPMELDSNVKGQNGWESHSFNFSKVASGDYTKLVIFFNAGVANQGEDVYYIDDLVFSPTIDPCEGIAADLSVISDFDCQQNFFIGDPTKETVAPVVDNPNKGGINNSDNVGKYTDDGTNAWDNMIIDLKDPIDLSQKSQLKIKIYSSKKVPVLAKLEGGTAVEKWADIAETDKWVEYTFNFQAAIGKGNYKVVLFFNGGKSDGTAEDVYYIDDIKFDIWIDPCVGIPADNSIVSDFECQQNYTFLNDAAPVVDNPDKSGENTSVSVGKYTDDGTNAWDNLLVDFEQAFDLTSNNQLHVKVHSSKAVPLLAKLEGGTPMEIWGEIDATGQWKNYVFDFSAAAGNGNTKLVLFFNGGKSDGTKTDTYYVDDIRFLPKDCSVITADCSGVTADLSIVSDFDCQQNYTFLNDSAPVVANPQVACANRSANVGEFTDNGKDAWDNLLVDFGGEIDLSTKNQLKFKVLSSKAVPILTKIEGGTAAEIWGNITVVDEWVEYSFDYSGSAGNGNTKLVLFFNGGKTDGTASDVYYVDDIRFELP